MGRRAFQFWNGAKYILQTSGGSFVTTPRVKKKRTTPLNSKALALPHGSPMTLENNRTLMLSFKGHAKVLPMINAIRTLLCCINPGRATPILHHHTDIFRSR